VTNEHTSSTVRMPLAVDRYHTLPRQRYDLIVIGGGSAGLPAAGLAVILGAKVALLDREALGGECLYTGCVPSKALLHVAHEAAHIRAAGRLGLDAALAPVDLGRVAGYVQGTIQTIEQQTDNPEHYVRMGVDVALGDVRFIAGDSVLVNGQRVTAKRFLIATGSHATVPPIPGLAETGYLTNETVFSMRRLPERIAVIGGGPVGCELGQAFARLGSQVTILQRADRLLPKDEPEASALLQSRLAADGVVVETRADVQGVERRENGKVVRYQTSAGAREMSEIAVDEVLVAVGRAPNIADLDLDAAGVRYDAYHGIAVDAYLRTSSRQIYAAGDVIGGYRFTHAAALQARTAVRNALFPGGAKRNERVMPWATFTEPAVAHVGMTEAQARQRHGDAVKVKVYVQQFREVDRAVTDSVAEGFVKLVCTRNGTLLGAQIVGMAAGEYINELALALQRRLTLADLASTTHVYPTLALALQQAAGQFTAARLRHSRLIRPFRALNGM
jgi:pyruvate/2-oxoglutarate dehydrogenase complex dihydrolipoamide dehydrogenase (E3) component